MILSMIKLIGGYDGTVLGDVLMFDPKNLDWKKTDTMKTTRFLHAVSLVNSDEVIDYCN